VIFNGHSPHMSNPEPNTAANFVDGVGGIGSGVAKLRLFRSGLTREMRPLGTA